MGRFKKGDDGGMRIIRVACFIFAAILGMYFIGSVGACELGEISLGEMIVRSLIVFPLMWGLISLCEGCLLREKEKRARRRSELKCFTYPYTDYKPNKEKEL